MGMKIKKPIVKTRKAAAAPSSRDKILDAVEEILVSRGPGSLSVDNILAVSGLSKGGFFYHFKTKEQVLLVSFMRLNEEMDRLIELQMKSDPNPRGRYLRANVSVWLDPGAGRRARKHEAMARVLIALLNENPKLIGNVKKISDEHEARLIADGLPRDVVIVAAQALDGIWISEAIGVSKYSLADKKRVRDFLFKLSYDMDK
jgi:AcrR family transcriptional regulator